MIRDFKELSGGQYDRADGRLQETIQEAVANFHYRDGKKHDDGSMGTIVITPGQLRDLLAWFASFK